MARGDHGWKWRVIVGAAVIVPALLINAWARRGPDPRVAEQPAATTTPDCGTETLEDEYGYPIEVDRCVDSSTEPRRTPTDLLASVPDPTSRDGLAAAIRAAEAMNAVCGDLVAWTSAGHQTSDAVFDLAALVADAPELAEWRGTDDAAELGAVLRNRLVIQSGCDPGEVTAPDAATLTEALGAAGRLAGANDAIWFAVTEPDRPQVSSEFWFGPDQIAHIAEARRLLTDGQIDVVITGASSAVRAYDPLALSAASGEVYINTGVAALLPLGVQSWLETLFEVGVDPERVILSLDAASDGLPCNLGIERRAESSRAFALRAFENVPGVGEQPGVMRLVGGEQFSVEGLLADLAASRWLPDSHGLSAGGAGRLPEQLEQQLELYTPRFTDAVVCDQGIEAVVETVEWLQARGVEAVAVALPVSDLMADLFPGGRDGVTDRVGDYGEVLDGLGVRLIDLSDLVDDELFADLTHLAVDGRTIFTEALITELAELSAS